jgi:hypothetical protein
MISNYNQNRSNTKLRYPKKWFGIAFIAAALLISSSCNDETLQNKPIEPSIPFISISGEGDIMDLDSTRTGEWWNYALSQTYHVFDGDTSTFTVMIDYQDGKGWIEGTSYPFQELFVHNLTGASYAKLVLLEHYIQQEKASLFEVNEKGEETPFLTADVKLKNCGLTAVNCWLNKFKSSAIAIGNGFKGAGRYAENAANFIANGLTETFSTSNMNQIVNTFRAMGKVVTTAEINSPYAPTVSGSWSFQLPLAKSGMLESKMKFTITAGEYGNTGKNAFIVIAPDGTVTIPEITIKVENKAMVLPPFGAKSGPEVTIKNMRFKPSTLPNSLNVGSLGLTVFAEYFMEHKTTLRVKVGPINETIGTAKMSIVPFAVELGTSINNWNNALQIVKNATIEAGGYTKVELQFSKFASMSAKAEWTYGKARFSTFF